MWLHFELRLLAEEGGLEAGVAAGKLYVAMWYAGSAVGGGSFTGSRGEGGVHDAGERWMDVLMCLGWYTDRDWLAVKAVAVGCWSARWFPIRDSM